MRRPFAFQQLAESSGLPAAIRWMNSRFTGVAQAIPLQTVVDLRDFNLDPSGQSDESTRIQQAINEAAVATGQNTLVAVRMPPNATYLCGDLTYSSYVRIIGSGKTSLLQKVPGATYLLSANPGAGGTSSVADNMVGISLENIALRGLAATSGFSEHHHLVNWNAVSDALLQRVWMNAMEGDGLYLGSSNTAATERHNERVTVRGLVGDGEVSLGRNLISIIDCDTFLGEQISGRRVTSVGQPAIIDIEPDPGTAFPIIKNIAIRGLRVTDNANGSAVNIALPNQDTLTTPCEGIAITDVVATDVRAGFGVQAGTPTATTAAHAIVMARWVVRNSTYPFFVDGVRGLSVSQFVGQNSTASATLGYTAGLTNRDVDFDDVTLQWCGTASTTKAGLEVRAVTGWTHRNLRLVDCGHQDGTGGTGIVFTGASTGQSIVANDLSVTSPNGYTTKTCEVTGGYTLLGDTCTDRNTRSTVGSTNDFIARESVIAGAPVAGAWTVGARTWEKVPVSAGYVGYVNTVAGSPGTWKGFGVIA